MCQLRRRHYAFFPPLLACSRSSRGVDLLALRSVAIFSAYIILRAGHLFIRGFQTSLYGFSQGQPSLRRL